MRQLWAKSGLFALLLSVLPHNIKAGGFHWIMTERQFRDEIVGKMIEQEIYHKLFAEDGVVLSFMRSKLDKPSMPDRQKRNRRALEKYYDYREGKWTWENEYLCVRMPVSINQLIRETCQVVLVSGDQILFVDNYGKGQHSEPYKFE